MKTLPFRFGLPLRPWGFTRTACARVEMVALPTRLPQALHLAWEACVKAHFEGKMSTFGGREDPGVGPDEGLALVKPSDVGLFSGIFLARNPAGTSGLARRLDPDAYYIACRWDYGVTGINTCRP